jgi:P-type conjugative transfer protein TrbL
MTYQNADLITYLINQYTTIFSGFFSQFLNWGNWLFYSFATIAMVWFCLWQAFEKPTAVASMPEFLKEFFLIAFFYTIMINAANWLSSIVDSAQTMGQQLTHQSIDPASIIQQGLTIANQILAPIKNSSAAATGLGTDLILMAYLSTLTAFIAVALDLAITLLTTTFFITVSGLFLAFGVFGFWRRVAGRTLDVVIGYSFKLLALYITIYAGSDVFIQLANNLPHDQVTTFDVYVWVSAAALLFWLTAFCLSKKVAGLFFQAIQAEPRCHAESFPLSPATERITLAETYSTAAYPSMPAPLRIPKSTHSLFSKPRG